MDRASVRIAYADVARLIGIFLVYHGHVVERMMYLGNVAAAHGDGVFIGRNQVGVVTSGTRSPILKKTIALARLDVTHAALGTEVEVGKLDGKMKRIPAKLVRFPHYDPEKTRVRA